MSLKEYHLILVIISLSLAIINGCSTGGSSPLSTVDDGDTVDDGSTGTWTGTRVEVINGVPTLLISSKAVAPTSLFVYNTEATSGYHSAGWLDTFKGYVDKAKGLGVTYISFGLYFHSAMFPTSTSVQPSDIGSDIDFSNMDALFDYAQQEGIYLLPTLWVDDPPEWWVKQHQDELQHSYDDPDTVQNEIVIDESASFNNPDYWAVMDEYLRVIIERYKSHRALLGWSPCIGVTRENNYGPSYIDYPTSQSWSDYSPYAKRRFRSWLTEKYGNDGVMQSAWGDSGVTLASAEPPLPQDSETDPVTIANGAGDIRPEMLDWFEFRIHEKGKEWEHFIGLTKSLDPEHIIVINPADPLFAPIGPTARSGAGDGPEWTRHPDVDMVIMHPRISYDDTAGTYNTQDYTLFAFVAYARHLGKIATFAMEDTGESISRSNIESYDRISSLAAMIASAGGGIGWVVESSKPEALPVWSDLELAKASEYNNMFDPANRSVTVPDIAILLDPEGDQVEYNLGLYGLHSGSRGRDKTNFYADIFNAGIKADPVDVSEVTENPDILDDYAGVIVANLARLDNSVAHVLYNYSNSGGGLFVGGRTGIFDGAGNEDYTAMKILLGLSSMPADNNISSLSWSFKSSSNPLLTGLPAGEMADTGNLYYIPTTNWSGEGFTELGVMGNYPSLLVRNKTVVWFPRLDITNANYLTTFLNNWKALL